MKISMEQFQRVSFFQHSDFFDAMLESLSMKYNGPGKIDLCWKSPWISCLVFCMLGPPQTRVKKQETRNKTV